VHREQVERRLKCYLANKVYVYVSLSLSLGGFSFPFGFGFGPLGSSWGADIWLARTKR